MLSAISRRNAVLHCAACSNVRGGTRRVFVRPAIDALAITAIPQVGTAALSVSATAVRMTPPMPRDPRRYPRLVRRDRKKQFMPRGQSADWGEGRQRHSAHGLVNASSCSWFHCLRSLGQWRALGKWRSHQISLAQKRPKFRGAAALPVDGGWTVHQKSARTESGWPRGTTCTQAQYG